MNYKIVIDVSVDNGDDNNDVIKISEYMQQRLDELGVFNQITRGKNESLSPEERGRRIRGFYGSGRDVIVLSNYQSATVDGIEIVNALRNDETLSFMIKEELLKDGHKVKINKKRLPSSPERDYHYILRTTLNNETLLVICGFFETVEDEKKYAEAIVRAVMRYIGKNYSVPVLDNSYVVKKGDTLWSIAKKFQLSVERLKEQNGLEDNLLSVGQIMQIKKPEESENCNLETQNVRIEHVVSKGETLYGIARKYEISVDDLKKSNNLNNSILAIGQILLIQDSK